MSENNSVILAIMVPLVFYSLLIFAVVGGYLWWGIAALIIMAITFFVRIKKRSVRWLSALHISLAIMGPLSGAAIIYLGAL
ncbi:hypothetical protein [Teredinibacter sp. KSP-S5-2]|uniref:hypothetical protein n=1 Tax=Teredinibacter sp. KSP-S5-2 TaxID=3034506 RepID=UPI002934459F|nr:hypothetical protein [Teredinibacter sp. KSP-S5-2]WNO10283.1 hypothetical protein P5V12_03765 [Teredinibacter sp. KSP-S5-2]